MKNLTKFGTKGFLCAMVASQMISFGLKADDARDKADRAFTDTKKSARSLKRDAKKTGRKITGNESNWEDFKDSAKDTGKDVKDEAKLQKRKAERRAE